MSKAKIDTTCATIDGGTVWLHYLSSTADYSCSQIFMILVTI